jgi:ferrochelatase
MKTGIILLNFGEPATADPEVVIDYLSRIFFANANLENVNSNEERWARSKELAQRRAPGLIEEYEEIGGSPLNEQAEKQAQGLLGELRRRGYECQVYSAMQYIAPFIGEIALQAKNDGIEKIVAIPVYPLCGRSTNVMALEELEARIAELEWEVEVHEITGWHRHPKYSRLRAENILAFAKDKNLTLADPGTELIFSAHGTPLKYLDEGNRYQQYVVEYCELLAKLVQAEKYTLGYQNHTNRNIEWTQPDIEKVIEECTAERILMEPVSFMHEQSETLAELDIELHELARHKGIEFHRAPVPFDSVEFHEVLADLAEPFVSGIESVEIRFSQCRCKPTPGTICLNSTDF